MNDDSDMPVSGQDVQSDAPPSTALCALAEAHGVATEYWSFFGERAHVPSATLLAVLRAMGVAPADDSEVDAALIEVEEQPWRELLPASFVTRQGAGELLVHVANGHDVTLEITFEDGSSRELFIPDQQPTSRSVGGEVVWRLRVPVPDDMPLGWHTVHARQWVAGASDPDRTSRCALVVTPSHLPRPASRPEHGGRSWGLMAQLYSVRSRGSWGMGDFADMGDLAATAGARGADFLLVNPIHAAEVTSPIEPSPYLPATRRFLAPLYVRPEDIRETAYLSDADRATVIRARESVAPMNTEADRIDRDAVWAAKRTALEAIFAVPRSAGRQGLFDDFCAREGQPLLDFALWCALEEHYAEGPPAAERPAEAWDIDSPLVAKLRAALSARVGFHAWLQWVADEQVEAAQAAATASGMRIGVMHDLAVGVHTRGSDAWSLHDLYAAGITVGAPPDMYNQQGQNWNQPPWLPRALAENAYAPLRDMMRTLLRHAGAIRIDHVIGLFRLWWIPAGLGPDAGTYVRYDHEAMVGVIALEAHRAGAVVIGEDLGNVEPWVREYLAARGILGTSVLWFEHEDDRPTPPEHYREVLLATVNTHDLPPTAGYLAGEHVDLRARLGLLTEPVAEVRIAAEAERDAMLTALRERGLIGAEPTEQQIIEALHLYLVAAPSQLIGVALVDAVGERRVQNQPGTDKEYPNWQIPLADSDGDAVLVEDLPHNERYLRLTSAVERALRESGGHPGD